MSILHRIRSLIGLGRAQIAPAERAADPLVDHEQEDFDTPVVSEIPGVTDAAAFWPESLAHLALPYDNGAEYVTVAEICEAPIKGFVGSKTVTVALVPHDHVDELLTSTAGTGYEVESQGPLPVIGEDGPPFRSGFWVSGIRRSDRFEPLVNAWRGSDTDVLMPDNSFQMAFGLVPRRTATPC